MFTGSDWIWGSTLGIPRVVCPERSVVYLMNGFHLRRHVGRLSRKDRLGGVSAFRRPDR